MQICQYAKLKGIKDSLENDTVSPLLRHLLRFVPTKNRRKASRRNNEGDRERKRKRKAFLLRLDLRFFDESPASGFEDLTVNQNLNLREFPSLTEESKDPIFKNQDCSF